MSKCAAWLERMLDRLFERFDIGRGDSNGEYMTRWMILGKRQGLSRYRVMLHRFRRSDLDVFHDHPWRFISIILAGGYHERTPKGCVWYPAGSVLFRPATWRHRVEIEEGATAWSLVITGPKQREWGFHCPTGWLHWKQADANLRSQGHVCA
jgi:hypothetical protein